MAGIIRLNLIAIIAVRLFARCPVTLGDIMASDKYNPNSMVARIERFRYYTEICAENSGHDANAGEPPGEKGSVNEAIVQ